MQLAGRAKMKRYHEAGFWGKLKFPRNQMNFWEREDQSLRQILIIGLIIFAVVPIGILLVLEG